MNQYGSSGGLHLGLHPTEVVEGWPSILWNTVVWPGSKVKLGHLQWSPPTLVTLWEQKTKQAWLVCNLPLKWAAADKTMQAYALQLTRTKSNLAVTLAYIAKYNDNTHSNK